MSLIIQLHCIYIKKIVFKCISRFSKNTLLNLIFSLHFQREIIRNEYDQLMKKPLADPQSIFDAMRKLCYFYRLDFEKDQERLVCY